MLNTEWKNYHCTAQDIRRAIEEHGRAISLSRLQAMLLPVARFNQFKYVQWDHMKDTVEIMVKAGELERVREPKGFYRYHLID